MTNKNIGRARILQQIKNMQKDKVQYLHAQPLQTDLYTWHFTFRGPQNTDFHEGLYHGQILLPFEYPFKPPDIIFANKNGRFQVNTKICLTITQYHTEEWNSAWTVRTMIQAVISLFNQKVIGHGYLQSSGQARRFFAKASHQYTCEKCGKISNILKPRQGMKNRQFLKSFSEEKIKIAPTQEYEYHEKEDEKKVKQNLNKEVKKERLEQEETQRKKKKERNKKQMSEQNSTEKIKLKSRRKDRQKKQLHREKQSQKVNKFISPQQFFYSTLMEGNQQYLTVLRSKRLIQE